MSPKQFTAVIPARKADAELNNKNILAFGDGNLLSHKIRQLKAVSNIDFIIVSTDSDQMADIAQEEGVLLDLRPPHLAKLDTEFADLVKHIATVVNTGHVVWTPVTCPLVTSGIYKDAIKVYLRMKHEGFDSLITCHKIKRHLLDENGPLSFRFHKSKRLNAKLPAFYEYINAISIAPTLSMLDWGYNWGRMPFRYALPESMRIDICSEQDYRISKFLYESYNEIHS